MILDSWCWKTPAQIYNLSPHQPQQLSKNLSNYIQNHDWNISNELNQIFPNLRYLKSQVTIPLQGQMYKLVWKECATEDLTLR